MGGGEGLAQRAQLVQGDAQPPGVGRPAVRRVPEHLGRHVVRSAHDARDELCLGRHEARHAKVGELDILREREQHVGRLDVAVEHLVRMQVLERGCQLPHPAHEQCLAKRRRERPIRLPPFGVCRDHVGERAALRVLHQQAEHALPRPWEGGTVLDNVRMAQRRQDAHLVLDRLEIRGVHACQG